MKGVNNVINSFIFLNKFCSKIVFMKRKTYNYILFIIGLIVLGIGISFNNKSMLGCNPMSIFVVGLSKHLPVSMGTCNLIVALIEMILGFLLAKENVSIATVIGVFGVSYAIDLGNFIIPDTSSVVIRIVYMIIGVIMYCLGFSIQQVSKCGYSHYDTFVFGLAKRLKIEKYHNIRWCTDALFLIFGYLLGGVLGIGTVLLLVLSGVLIERFKEIIESINK